MPYFIQAYKRWINDHGEEKVLPGLDKNSDELFFIGFAQVCRGRILFFVFDKSVHSNGCATVDRAPKSNRETFTYN